MHCRRAVGCLFAVVATAAFLVACSGDSSDKQGTDQLPPPPAGLRIPAPEATGLVVTTDHTVVAGSRSTGDLVEIDPDTGTTDPLVAVPGVNDELAQGGLLGLVVQGNDLLASYTNDDGRLVIAKLFRTPLEGPPLWTGPVAKEAANGGRMAFLGDGTLLIGVGDLQEPDLADDPAAPNSKILAIGADGTAQPWATGFNNPFALASDGDATVWVADNAPGSQAERLLRVTEGEIEVVAQWDETRVPSALAVLDDGRLAVCYFATGTLAIIDPADPGDGSGTAVANDCAYSVVQLPNGDLAYSTETAVVFIDAPA